jgi:NuA3 HAT complex component NTO1
MQLSSAAAVAAAVVQSEGYKPREERGWEEFHPNLDIEATFMVFNAEDVDGVPQASHPAPSSDAPVNGAGPPSKEGAIPLVESTSSPKPQGKPALEGVLFSTPPRRRPGRPPRDPVAFYAAQAGLTPKTPKVLPIHNQTPKERLDLKLPSYRKTDRILLFESKTFGQARYVDKSMMNVGYQESDIYIRPERNLIKAADSNADEDVEPSWAYKSDADVPPPAVQNPAGVVGRVEYDMDEQDDMWLEKLNTQRRTSELAPITREIFEITITKIEKEWHALEKRIPKPNPKPPQTHRPRSSSAAAVNGEPQAGEEQDSKCAICDDGDCENTNAIVFCDGCDLAVHQECYGVPFIPEGQWLCRKCQLIGRGIPVSARPSCFLVCFSRNANENARFTDMHFLPEH